VNESTAPVSTDPHAKTAGEENHANPDNFRGEDADAPTNPDEDGDGEPADHEHPPLTNADIAARMVMAAWRNCQASMTLVAAINARWPGRDKASDGTIGDAAHATRTSDHNPWVVVDGMGVVRARDIDKDGIDAAWLAEELRKLGAAGDPRLAGGGYVIFNRRITTNDWSGWKVYTGSNPHTAHLHVSFSLNRAGYDSAAGWVFLGGGAVVQPSPEVNNGIKYEERVDAPNGARILSIGKVGSDVAYVQRWHGLTDDGFFGTATDDAVRKTQGRNGLLVDGVVGPQTWALMGVGNAPIKPSIPPLPAKPGWDIPRGEYLGDITGPKASHGGGAGVDGDNVLYAQRVFIARGCVPGQADWRSGWADAKWEGATTGACRTWFSRYRPGQPHIDRIYSDDWAVLG